MSGWWIALAMTAVNFAVALYSGRQRRATARALLRADGRTLGAIARAARLQQAVDRAWDAAHEFMDDPQLALNVVCEHLEPHITPLPDLDRALRDPSIVTDRDHEIRLADGRTLAEHMAEWREFPKQRPRPCGEGPCMFEPALGERFCPWCGWERPA